VGGKRNLEKMNAPRFTAIVVTALVAAYPLSSGPVVRSYLGHKHPSETTLPKPVRDFYWPMVWLSDQVPILGKAWNWYGDLWLGDW
jgi:hypothetical protein